MISGNTAFLEQNARDAKVREPIGAISSAVASAAAMCDQLQAFAGRGSNAQRRMSVASAIADTIRAFRTRVPPHVIFEACVDASLPEALLDGVAIARATMNLLVNALEALPAARGRITLSVREAVPSAGVRTRGYDFLAGSGRCALLEVTDTGVGVPPALIAGVSEPFFFTKERGSGFGLATVLGTVRAHRRLFHVESVEGKGSRFRIWLPLVED